MVSLSLCPGLCQEGVYQRPGDPDRVALLLGEFTRDARNVKLRESEHHLEDVTDILKSFLSQSEDALLTKELYPYWVSVLGMSAIRRNEILNKCNKNIPPLYVHHDVHRAVLVRVAFLDEKDAWQRVKKYSTFIESLPKINRSTLEALLQHLYRYTLMHTLRDVRT